MRGYLKVLIFPVIWEIIFIASCIWLPEDYYIYTNFLFYLGIIVYFMVRKDFSFKELGENLKEGKKFWRPVLFTALGLLAAFILSGIAVSGIGAILPGADTGTMNLKRDSWMKLILFAVSTILFPPLAEELFYRKAVINFKNKNILIFTSIIGMFLYALEHSLGWLGILESMIIAIPFTLSYIKTKNIYIPMAAHFLVNLIGNGISVVVTALYLAGVQ